MKWYLTQRLCGWPEIDVREDDEDLELGFKYLRALAAEDGRSVWQDSGNGPGYIRPLPAGRPTVPDELRPEPGA